MDIKPGKYTNLYANGYKKQKNKRCIQLTPLTLALEHFLTTHNVFI